MKIKREIDSLRKSPGYQDKLLQQIQRGRHDGMATENIAGNLMMLTAGLVCSRMLPREADGWVPQDRLFRFMSVYRSEVVKCVTNGLRAANRRAANQISIAGSRHHRKQGCNEQPA
jgi:hypothetical protein